MITLDKENVRIHPDANKAAIKNSLSSLGAGRSILIDADDVLIAGNGVYEQAEALGIPVKVIETNGKELIAVKRTDLNADDERRVALAIADNRLTDLSEFDDDALNKMLDELSPDMQELAGYAIDANDLMNEGNTDEDEVPEVTEATCKLGDLWVLGNHRLLCGDSTDKEQVEKLMDGEKADMVFTDPPYNVNYESKHTGKIKNDNMSDEDFEEFVRSVYLQIDNAAKTDSSIYICHATMVLAFDTVLREMPWEINNKIIWVKDIPTFSMARYKWQYEPIHFCLKGKPKFYGDKKQTNIWEVRSIQSAGNTDDNGNTWFKGGSENLTLHPTQKPYQLVSIAIGNSSKPGDLLFEPFTGSGSTLIACEKTNRKCYGMELDPKYCDIIIERWQNYTGEKAVKHAI